MQQPTRVTVFFNRRDINGHCAVRDRARGRESEITIDGKCDVRCILVVEVDGLVGVDLFKFDRIGGTEGANGPIHL